MAKYINRKGEDVFVTDEHVETAIELNAIDALSTLQ